MKFEDIPTPAVYRLSFYLRQLEALRAADKHTISSKQLGDALGYTDAQVRRTWPISASSVIPESDTASKRS